MKYLKRVINILVIYEVRFLLRLLGSAEYLLNLVIRLDWKGRPRLNPNVLTAQDKISLLDIGARGGLPSWFLPYQENLDVYYVEPDSTACFGRDVVAKSHVIKKGLSNYTGVAELKITRSPGGSSLYSPTGAWRDFYAKNLEDWEVVETQKIEVTTIGEALRGVEVDILKIDVQGGEFDVIEGLGEVRPFLIYCEVSGIELYEKQQTVYEVTAKLRSLGYMLANNRMYYSSTPVDNIFRSTIQTHGDCVFIPDFLSGGYIIERNYKRFVQCLCIAGLSDFVAYYLRKGAIVPSDEISYLIKHTDFFFDPF